MTLAPPRGWSRWTWQIVVDDWARTCRCCSSEFIPEYPRDRSPLYCQTCREMCRDTRRGAWKPTLIHRKVA